MTYYIEIGVSIALYMAVFFICRMLKKKNGGMTRKLRGNIACLWAVCIMGLLVCVVMIESSKISGAIITFAALCAAAAMITVSALRDIEKNK